MHYLQRRELERLAFPPEWQAHSGANPSGGWRYRGEGAEVWQLPLAGNKAAHPGGSLSQLTWPWSMVTSCCQCLVAADSARISQAGIPLPTVFSHGNEARRPGGLGLRGGPSSPGNTGWFPPPGRDLRTKNSARETGNKQQQQQHKTNKQKPVLLFS